MQIISSRTQSHDKVEEIIQLSLFETSTEILKLVKSEAFLLTFRNETDCSPVSTETALLSGIEEAAIEAIDSVVTTRNAPKIFTNSCEQAEEFDIQIVLDEVEEMILDIWQIYGEVAYVNQVVSEDDELDAMQESMAVVIIREPSPERPQEEAAAQFFTKSAAAMPRDQEEAILSDLFETNALDVDSVSETLALNELQESSLSILELHYSEALPAGVRETKTYAEDYILSESSVYELKSSASADDSAKNTIFCVEEEAEKILETTVTRETVVEDANLVIPSKPIEEKNVLLCEEVESTFEKVQLPQQTKQEIYQVSWRFPILRSIISLQSHPPLHPTDPRIRNRSVRNVNIFQFRQTDANRRIHRL